MLRSSFHCTGKAVTLCIVAERLAAQREVKVGVLSRPQSRPGDFYRELGDLLASCSNRTTAGTVSSCCADVGRLTSMPPTPGRCWPSTRPGDGAGHPLGVASTSLGTVRLSLLITVVQEAKADLKAKLEALLGM
jgi:hypothetical protein